MTCSFPLRAFAGACVVMAAIGAHAQALQLHGLLDMTAGRFQNAGAAHVWRADSGGMSSSFIGFSGTDDLGGGLKAKFAFEHFLRADSGQAGRNDRDGFWARDAYVGLSGAFGTSVLGRNTTPLFVSTVLFNAFGDSYAFSPSVRQLFTPALLPFLGDSAWNNSLAYAANENDGLSHNLIGSLGEGASGAMGKNMGANVLYLKGPLGATIAWQRVRHGLGISSGSALNTAPAGFVKQETWQLGLSYDMNIVKLYGQLTKVRTRAQANTRTELWSLGAAMPIGAGRLLAQYGSAHARVNGSEPANRTISIGYDHSLSKRTDLYAVFMNDRVSGLGNGNTLAGGVRTRF